VEKVSARYEAGTCFVTRNTAAARTLGGGSVSGVSYKCFCTGNTVILRLTKIIRSVITFVSRNVISRRFL